MNKPWNRFVLVSAIALCPLSAHAVNFQGNWPNEDATVSLDLEEKSAEEAVRAAADSAGVGLVESLPDDLPDVTIHVRNAPLRDVIQAILGDASVTATRTGSIVTLRTTPEGSSGMSTPQGGFPMPPPPPMPGGFMQPPPPPPVPGGFMQQPPPPGIPGMAHGPGMPGMHWGHGGFGHRGQYGQFSQGPQASDRTTFGEDVLIRRGDRVHDVTTMGGDVTVEGDVTGDVTTMGGDVRVRPGGVVRGDLVTMGGDVTVDEGASVFGRRVGIGDAGRKALGRDHGGGGPPRWVYGAYSDVPGHLVRFALLFLLGLILMGASPDRLGALQRALVRVPARCAGMGALGIPGGVLLTAVLAITVIGIPAAIVLALALSLGVFVGLAAVASVLGAMLPLQRFKDRPVQQLALGIVVMLAVSFVPVLGPLALFAAAVIGAGAVVLTRFKDIAPGDPGWNRGPQVDAGAYRTNAA